MATARAPGQILAIRGALDFIGNGKKVSGSDVQEMCEGLLDEGVPVFDILK